MANATMPHWTDVTVMTSPWNNVIGDVTTPLWDDVTSNGTNSSGPPGLPPPDINDILMLYTEYRWSRYVGIYGYPIMIALGLVGNLLSVLVMTRRSMMVSSTCLYMAALALADILVMIFGCLRKWLTYLNGWDAVILSPTACKVFSFLNYYTFHLAVWILVAMTIDRFVAVRFPLQQARWASVRRARLVVAAVSLLLVPVNAHFFATITISSRGYCMPPDQHKFFVDAVWPWIDVTLYSFLPFLLLAVFNTLVVVESHKAWRRQRWMRARRGCGQAGLHHHHRRLTVMLLTVSVSFLVSTAPKTIIIIIEPYVFDFLNAAVIDFPQLALYTLITAVLNFVLFTSHATNFFLYCISGSRFRHELLEMMRSCRYHVMRRQRMRRNVSSSALELARQPNRRDSNGDGDFTNGGFVNGNVHVNEDPPKGEAPT